MLTSDYTTVVSNLLAGNASYMPNYLYVEFANSDNPTIPVDTQGVEYYQALHTANPTVGYLRIPITIKPTVSNNRITYTVLMTAIDSVNGLSFGEGSRIYGVALVSAITPEDISNDIVFAREYFQDTSKQLVMTANQTFCFSFKLALFDGVAPSPEEINWNEEDDEE